MVVGVEKDVVVAAGKLGEVTIKVAVNPFDAANQLSTMLAALQQAAETAELCNDMCKDIVATADSRIHILCKLLAVGHVYADQETELNAAMNRTLWRTVNALGEAAELMYEYMSLNRVSRWNAAASTKDKMAEKRTYLTNRFNDIQAHLQLSTWLKVKEGVEAVVPLVGAVEGIRRDLDALQHLHKADRSRVQAVAAAAAKRKRDKGQKVVVFDDGGGFQMWQCPQTASGLPPVVEVGVWQCGMPPLASMCGTCMATLILSTVLHGALMVTCLLQPLTTTQQDCGMRPQVLLGGCLMATVTGCGRLRGALMGGRSAQVQMMALPGCGRWPQVLCCTCWRATLTASGQWRGALMAGWWQQR